MNRSLSHESHIRIISGVVTLVVAVLLFLFLWFVTFTVTPTEEPAKTSPALLAIDEEEFIDPEEFIEPPMEVENAGEPNPMTNNDDSPAPSPAGEPEPSPVKSDKVSTSGKNQTPNSSSEKLVTQKQTSPLTHANPSPKDVPDSKITTEVGGRFTQHNGSPDGKQTGTSGSSQDGSGAGSAEGYLDGKRKMLSCNNKFPIKISKDITVKVSVTVNDKGRVIKAKCLTQLADKSLARKLEQESLGSTWTPKAGAPDAIGTITWHLKAVTK